MYLTDQERAVGRENYYSAVTAHDQMTRRDFLVTAIAGGAGALGGLGALYFGYHQPARRVRVGLIGTGDEGGVLIGALNPDYVEVAGICDIRPSSIHRALHGDWSSPSALAARPGLISVYGWSGEEQARQQLKIVSDYRELIDDPSIDGVIIALPLHLHASVALAAMAAGKHVLCEKLMAHNVAQCKLMARAAEQTRRFLAIGHQRHYSILYDNAVHLLRWGLLGEIHHVRAQWHRNNLPGSDSWAAPLPGGETPIGSTRRLDAIRRQLDQMMDQVGSGDAQTQQLLRNRIAQWEAWDRDQLVDAERYGYVADAAAVGNSRERSALEELVRWRLWDRTGGGLMAELGSHQLDAASLFVSALAPEGHHARPLSVHAVGGRHIFPPDRQSEDHVYCMFEYPGPGYAPDFPVGYEDAINRYPDPERGVAAYDVDPNKRIVVTYSSINGNGFGGYGEVVMGTRGSLVLEREQEVMLFPSGNTQVKVGVTGNAQRAVLDTTATGDPGPARSAESAGPISRGYREEIEHWSWCIAQGDWDNQPRCNGPVALGDATVALVARLAIKNSQRPGGHGFVAFRPEWFDVDDDAVPESELIPDGGPTIQSERRALGLV